MNEALIMIAAPMVLVALMALVPAAALGICTGVTNLLDRFEAEAEE